MKQNALPLFFALAIFAFYDSKTWEVLVQKLNANRKESIAYNSLTQKGGATFQVSSIVQFDWLKGNYEWAEPSKQRLLQSQFIFNSDGSFTYVLPYDNSTTYRLYGAWSLNEEGERIFEGSTGSSNGAGSGTSILISGRVYSYAGQSRATISYASGASYYAKVNNSEFTNSASKRFNAKVVLVK